MKGLNSPHLLLASSNPIKMIKNLSHLLAENELAKLTDEVNRNAVALFDLGLIHYSFAVRLSDNDWRQKISRLYYGVYNVRRAIMLKNSGVYSTDSSDHKSVDQLPETLSNRESYISRLRDLREDRNLADYSHLAEVSDLVLPPSEAMKFAESFIFDCRNFMVQCGLAI